MNIFQQIVNDLSGKNMTEEEMQALAEAHRQEVLTWLERRYPQYDISRVALPDAAFVKDAEAECAKCPGIDECSRKGMVSRMDFGSWGYPSVAMHECDQLSQRKWERSLERMMQQSMLPEPLRKCRFENFLQRDADCKRLLTAAKTASGNGQSLVLASETNGNGKTHLAAALLNRAIKNKRKGLFVSSPEMLESLRADAIRKDEAGESRTIRLLTEADVLVIDDFGKERLTASNKEFVGERLFAIVNDRYLHRDKKQLVVTTNQADPKMLAYRLGDHGKAIVSRLYEMCGSGGWVVSKSSDYRQAKMRQGAA